MQTQLTKQQKTPFSSVDLRSWGLVVLAAMIWFTLYNVIQPFANWIAYGLLALPQTSHLGESLAFFFYDVPKIILLLGGMIFLITMLRSFFSAEQTRAWLGGKREGVGNVMAAALGIITPFCSCSAVPLFIGFVESGIPLGVTFSFLISAPVVNEMALVMLFGLFGWKIAGLIPRLWLDNCHRSRGDYWQTETRTLCGRFRLADQSWQRCEPARSTLLDSAFSSCLG